MENKIEHKNRFVVCINDSEPDLELRKIYQVFLDKSAEKDNYIRIIDESGEDYLYPQSYFVFIGLPYEAEHVLAVAS
jgi:hypothetical protein